METAQPQHDRGGVGTSWLNFVKLSEFLSRTKENEVHLADFLFPTTKLRGRCRA